MEFSPKDVRNNALRFSEQIFKEKLLTFINEKYAEFKAT
jgi:hypothetical protein